MDVLAGRFSVARRTLKKSVDDGVTDLASSIAFYAFFGLFPLALAVIAVAGHLLESGPAEARFYDFLAEIFPGSGEQLNRILADVVAARGSMGVAAVLGLLWSASAGFGAIGRAINLAVGAQPTHSLLQAKLRYLLMTLTVSVLLVASLALTSAVQFARLDAAWFPDLGLRPDTVTGFKVSVISFVIVFLMFTLVYKEAPTIKTRWREVWPGALLATILAQVAKILFVAYVDYVADLEAVFGSLAAIMAILLWLYVSAIALIIGAEFSSVRAEDRRLRIEANPI